jgi:hypothetical protein
MLSIFISSYNTQNRHKLPLKALRDLAILF